MRRLMPTTTNDRLTIFVCGRKRENCSTPGCRNNADRQCDFPVKRNGQNATCDRFICSACAVRVGPNLDHCGPHARAAAKGVQP